MDCSPPGSSVHGILQQEDWSGLPCPPPGDLPDLGIMEPVLLRSPALSSRFFTTSTSWEALENPRYSLIWEGRQRGLLSRARQAPGENWRRRGRFPSNSAPKCLFFFFPLLGPGRIPALAREKGEVSFPGTHNPNPVELLHSPVWFLWMSVFAAGVRTRLEPRTTCSSAHSRWSCLPNVLPKETSESAGAECGWGFGGWVSCGYQKAPWLG